MIAIIITSCNSKKDEDIKQPRDIVMLVADAVLAQKESTEARQILGQSAESIRNDVMKSAAEFYMTKGRYTESQVDEMVRALFDAIDSSIVYTISEAAYTDEDTAYVDIYIWSIDQEHFIESSNSFLEDNLTQSSDDLSDIEKAYYSFNAFLASCEDIRISEEESRITVKLTKTSNTWRIHDILDLTIRLIAEYTGTLS